MNLIEKLEKLCRNYQGMAELLNIQIYILTGKLTEQEARRLCGEVARKCEIPVYSTNPISTDFNN